MLTKTTELPPRDKTAANRTFHALVHDEPLVLFVVLGEDEDAAELVERADKVAGGPNDLRWVVWMRNPKNHEQQIAELKSSKLLQGEEPVAFCTNHDDEVCEVVRKSERPVKFTRILKAFAKGEV